MSIIIGMDIGMSTCKITGFSNDSLLIPVQKISGDFSDSEIIKTGISEFLYTNKLKKQDIGKIMITGVGSSYISHDIEDIPTLHVAEFDANAAYGSYVCDSSKYIIISMGTGSSYVYIGPDGKKHLGGLALGGGTIQGLSNIIFSDSDFEFIKALSQEGNIRNIDLCMGDITKTEIPGLPSDITASNFAKAGGNEAHADIAQGIVHMVIENILQTGALIGKGYGVNTYVLMGGLAGYPQCHHISEQLKLLHKDIEFIIPKHSMFGSAIGAALLSK